MESNERIARHRAPLDFLARAEVHREAGRRAEARADLARAASLAPGLPAVALMRARLHMDGGEHAAARAVLDRLLAREPRLGAARALRAEALEAEAAQELDRALGELERQTPDQYLHLARLLVASDPPQSKRALAVLERGVARLGPAPALVEQAVALELELGRAPAALKWHDRLRPFRETDPEWLARRGELLEAAGQRMEALAAYTAALDAIEALPPGRRTALATRRLDVSMRVKLHR